LAILDAHGVVVCWYGSRDGKDYEIDSVIDRHVSQFCVAEDLALCLPTRDLRKAWTQGCDTQEG